MTIIFGAGVALGAGVQVLADVQTNFLWAWGDNTNGKLGLGDTVKRSSPVQVGALGTWSNASMSKGSSAAITITGNLFTWGYNNSGKLGNGNTTNYSSPKQVGALTTWSTVAAGQYHMAAIKTDGTLWTWGSSIFGELGLGNTTNYSSPKQIGALTTWSKITAGVRISAAIKTDGTLWAWGYNSSGALGLGDVIKRSSPVQVGALTNWSNVSLNTDGNSSVNAIIATKTNGTMWSWGANDGAQLGVGNGSQDSINRSSPTQIGSATTWGVGRIGSKAGMGIKTDGTLWTWGYNYSGDQGDNRPAFGAGSANSGPVQVGLLTDWWSSWNKTSMGWRTGFVIKSDGTLWTWGNNDTGQLGKNNTANTSSPVQLGSLNTWTLVSSGPGTGQDTGVLAIASHAT